LVVPRHASSSLVERVNSRQQDLKIIQSEAMELKQSIHVL